MPRTTREVGAWIEHAFGIVYESRSGLIALLHRLGLEHRKPQAASRKLDPARQKVFIGSYAALLKTLPDDERDVHRRGASHPWGTAGGLLGTQRGQGSRSRWIRPARLNIHGAIDLETGRTRMIEVLTVDAVSTIALLVAIEALYPAMQIIPMFLDNAR